MSMLLATIGPIPGRRRTAVSIRLPCCGNWNGPGVLWGEPNQHNTKPGGPQGQSWRDRRSHEKRDRRWRQSGRLRQLRTVSVL